MLHHHHHLLKWLSEDISSNAFLRAVYVASDDLFQRFPPKTAEDANLRRLHGHKLTPGMLRYITYGNHQVPYAVVPTAHSSAIK